MEGDGGERALVLYPTLVQGPDRVKNKKNAGLTKSEVKQGWLNWANLQG